jgi:sigma-B regulation protein RsbU (phosphoserine phosphatase)
LTLFPLTDARMPAFVAPPERVVTVGRLDECELCLKNEAVSRRHARLSRHGDSWFIQDLKSSHGTYVNGIRIDPARPSPLAGTDLVRIGPWTFRVWIGDSPPPRTAAVETPSSADRVTGVGLQELESPTGRRLRLLTECAARLHGASDSHALAETALDAAIAGTGFVRGCILRPVGVGSGVEVTASRGGGYQSGQVGLSRSLIDMALRGEMARLSGASPMVASHSVIQMGIHSALCAPIMLGKSVEALLYLDARGKESAVHDEAAGFCQAITQIYGLALANTKRQELENRQLRLQADLEAAREAQQMLLPAPDGERGPVHYSVRASPGHFVAGDLFDIVNLDDGRVAVCIGDVMGKGIGSAILMVCTQSFLHAEIRRTGDPGAALVSVNNYVAERVSGGRFVTLWVGIFDGGGGLAYTDAGHGYWLHKPAGQPARQPPPGGGILIGIEHGQPYTTQTMQLARGDRIILHSDGANEQRDAHGEQFGSERLIAALAESGSTDGDVEAITRALTTFAGTEAFDDDTTVASVEFAPGAA